MIDENKLLMIVQLTDLDDEEKSQEISDWAVLTRPLIQPTLIRFFTQQADPYNFRKLREKIMLASARDEGWPVVRNNENEYSSRLRGNQLLIESVLSITVFKKNRFLIWDFIQEKMIAHGVLVYVRAYSEFIYHNTKEIIQRLLFETMGEIERLPKIEQESGDVIMDCSQFPGYDLFYRGLCFILCWEVYCSCYYHRITPKSAFLDT